MLHPNARQDIARAVLALWLALCLIAQPSDIAPAENAKSARAQVDAAIEQWHRSIHVGDSANALEEYYATLKSIGTPAIPRLVEVVGSGADTRRRLLAIGSLSWRFGEDAHAAEPALRKLLEEDFDGEDRILWIAAIQALNKIAPDWAQTAVPVVTRLLDQGDSDVRANAILSLRDAGPEARGVTPRLIQILKTDESNNCKELAAEALTVIAPDSPEAVSALIETLEGPLPRIRALGCYGPRAKDAVPRLIELLGDRYPRMRKDAAVALGAIGPEAKAALPVLMEHFEQDEEAFVRARCAKALIKIGASPRDVIPVLIRDCQSHDCDSVKSAAELLGQIGAPAKEAIPQLLRLLEEHTTCPGINENDRISLRGAAAIALGRIAEDREGVVPALTKRLADDDPWVRVLSAVALSQYGVTTPESVVILKNALRDRDYNVIPALTAMDTIGREEVPLFLAMSRHEEKHRRVFGITALAACRTVTDDMLSAISQRLKDRDSYVRVIAARTLGEIGPRANTQVGALREAARTDKDWVVRRDAQEAIDKIEASAEGTNEK